MAKSLVKRSQQSLVEPKNDVFPLWNPLTAAYPFVRFTHSYSEVTSDGLLTHVKSTTTRLADGKLSNESVEGSLPANAFGDVVEKTQLLFLKQAMMLMQPWWAPFSKTRLPGGSKE